MSTTHRDLIAKMVATEVLTRLGPLAQLVTVNTHARRIDPDGTTTPAVSFKLPRGTRVFPPVVLVLLTDAVFESARAREAAIADGAQSIAEILQG